MTPQGQQLQHLLAINPKVRHLGPRHHPVHQATFTTLVPSTRLSGRVEGSPSGRLDHPHIRLLSILLRFSALPRPAPVNHSSTRLRRVPGLPSPAC